MNNDTFSVLRIEDQQDKAIAEARAKYKIICRFINEKDKAKELGMTRVEFYYHICNQEKVNFGLDDTFYFSYFTAMSRVRRKNLQGLGVKLPLADIEPDLAQLILCMSKIKCSLTVSEGLHLCNQLIAGTDVQQRLIDFKTSQNIYAETPEDLGRVGRYYWNKFLKRNWRKIKSKTPKKFSLDQSMWTTYMNFGNMYHHVEEVMVESKIATRLPESVWMNS